MRTREEIGRTIMEARRKKGLSRTQLGYLIGFPEGQRCDTVIERIEKGLARPPYERLRALHDVLDLPFTLLIP